MDRKEAPLCPFMMMRDAKSNFERMDPLLNSMQQWELMSLILILRLRGEEPIRVERFLEGFGRNVDEERKKVLTILKNTVNDSSIIWTSFKDDISCCPRDEETPTDNVEPLMFQLKETWERNDNQLNEAILKNNRIIEKIYACEKGASIDNGKQNQTYSALDAFDEGKIVFNSRTEKLEARDNVPTDHNHFANQFEFNISNDGGCGFATSGPLVVELPDKATLENLDTIHSEEKPKEDEVRGEFPRSRNELPKCHDEISKNHDEAPKCRDEPLRNRDIGDAARKDVDGVADSIKELSIDMGTTDIVPDAETLRRMLLMKREALKNNKKLINGVKNASTASQANTQNDNIMDTTPKNDNHPAHELEEEQHVKDELAEDRVVSMSNSSASDIVMKKHSCKHSPENVSVRDRKSKFKRRRLETNSKEKFNVDNIKDNDDVEKLQLSSREDSPQQQDLSGNAMEDIQQIQPHPSQQVQPYLSQQAQPHPLQQAQPHPPQHIQPHPPQQAQPHPPQHIQPHPPQHVQPHPPQHVQPHPPQHIQPHPPQHIQPHPPQQTQPHPSQQTQPHPSQQTDSVQAETHDIESIVKSAPENVPEQINKQSLMKTGKSIELEDGEIRDSDLISKKFLFQNQTATSKQIPTKMTQKEQQPSTQQQSNVNHDVLLPQVPSKNDKINKKSAGNIEYNSQRLSDSPYDYKYDPGNHNNTHNSIQQCFPNPKRGHSRKNQHKNKEGGGGLRKFNKFQYSQIHNNRDHELIQSHQHPLSNPPPAFLQNDVMSANQAYPPSNSHKNYYQNMYNDRYNQSYKYYPNTPLPHQEQRQQPQPPPRPPPPQLSSSQSQSIQHANRSCNTFNNATSDVNLDHHTALKASLISILSKAQSNKSQANSEDMCQVQMQQQSMVQSMVQQSMIQQQQAQHQQWSHDWNGRQSVPLPSNSANQMRQHPQQIIKGNYNQAMQMQPTQHAEHYQQVQMVQGMIPGVLPPPLHKKQAYSRGHVLQDNKYEEISGQQGHSSPVIYSNEYHR